MTDKVNILGTIYTITKVDYNDPILIKLKATGYCDRYTHSIIYADIDTSNKHKDYPEETKRNWEKYTLRHEITHAFLAESGVNKIKSDNYLSADEGIVDWIATQGEKIYKAWEEVGCLSEDINKDD